MCISLHAKKDLISNYYTLQIVYLYIIVVFTSSVDTIFTKNTNFTTWSCLRLYCFCKTKKQIYLNNFGRNFIGFLQNVKIIVCMFLQNK